MGGGNLMLVSGKIFDLRSNKRIHTIIIINMQKPPDSKYFLRFAASRSKDDINMTSHMNKWIIKIS